MDAAKVIGACVGLATLIGAGAALDARYWHAEAGEQVVQQLKVDIEKVRLSNDLAAQRARLSFLANKSKLSTDEKLEADFVRSQVSLLQAQISALQK